MSFYDPVDEAKKIWINYKELINEYIKYKKNVTILDILPDASDDLVSNNVAEKYSDIQLKLINKFNTNPRNKSRNSYELVKKSIKVTNLANNSELTNSEPTNESINDSTKKVTKKSTAKFSEDFLEDGKLSIKNVMKEFQYHYKEFFERFPIITRYMIESGQFNVIAFKRYIKKLRDSPATDMCMHITERNADYVKYLWQENNKKHPEYGIMSKQIWNDTYKMLKHEWDMYEIIQEEAKNRIIQRDEQSLKEKKQELLQFLSNNNIL